jgi:hypothetical protein
LAAERHATQESGAVQMLAGIILEQREGLAADATQ